MQSSGASTLALLLAQKPECSAFIDIWTMYAAPALPGDDDVVAKVVVTTTFPLALHQERFRPDRTILFLRHPEANYRSLASKGYRHHCGFMEEKFAALDRVFLDETAYDAVLHYEDLILDPLHLAKAVQELGWTWDPAYLRLRRKQADIIEVNRSRYPGLTGRLEYGVGNHRPGGLLPELTRLADLPAGGTEVATWCPAVMEHYRGLMGPDGRKNWSLPQKE
jgi:hypothetical protein